MVNHKGFFQSDGKGSHSTGRSSQRSAAILQQASHVEIFVLVLIYERNVVIPLQTPERATTYQRAGNVELGGHAGVLRVANQLTVDPQVHARIHPVESHMHAAALVQPGGGHLVEEG